MSVDPKPNKPMQQETRTPAVFGPDKDGRHLIVQTAKSAGHDYARRGGYCIRIDPPYAYQQDGIDVEGIGWHRWPQPRTITQRFCGWYRHKADAMARARSLVSA